MFSKRAWDIDCCSLSLVSVIIRIKNETRTPCVQGHARSSVMKHKSKHEAFTRSCRGIAIFSLHPK